jgi:hypothetical protein
LREKETETERDRYRDRETERQRDRETERQRDRETERQRDRETERQRDKHTQRQTKRQTYTETDKERHPYTETDRDMEVLTIAKIDPDLFWCCLSLQFQTAERLPIFFKIYFMILSFVSLDFSTHPGNAASRVTDPNI